MEDFDVSKIMNRIPEHFNPENARSIEATVQCIFTGDQASNWVIKIEDETCSVEEGKSENPDLTIKADAEVGVKVLMGETDPMRAYLLGKVKVYGDISFGMKLAKLFG